MQTCRKEQTKALLNATLDAIVEVVKSNEKLLFSDFGAFYISHRSKRKGRNPATGKAITLPAFKLPAFKAGSTFKRALNEPPGTQNHTKKQTKPNKQNA